MQIYVKREMDMEVKDVYSDMHSLRKLYGHLLQSNNNSDDTMDEKARLLLKNLLDNATEGLFQAVSKIMAVAQSDVSDLSCPFQPMQPKTVSHLEPSVATYGIQASPCAFQGFKLDSDFLANNLLRDDQYLSKPNVQDSFSEISVLSIPQQKPDNTKKRCRVCQKVPVHRNVKGLLDGKEKSVRAPTGKEKTIKERKHEIQTKPGVANSVVCHSGPQCTGIGESQGEGATGQMDKNIVGAAGDFSGEVANAIKRIETGILTFQLLFHDVEPVEVTGAACDDSSASTMQSKVGRSIISRAMGDAGNTGQRIQNTRQIFDRLPKFTNSPTKPVSQMVGNSKPTESTNELLSQSLSQNVKDKAILGRIESLRQASSQYVYGLRVPLNQDGVEDDKHSMHSEKIKILGKSNRTSLVNDPVAYQGNKVKFKKSTSHIRRSVRSTSSSHKYLPSHQTISPTLLDHEPPPLKPRDSGKHMTTKGPLYARPQHHKILPLQQESEEGTRSSSWALSSDSCSSHRQTKSTSSSSYNHNSLSTGMSKTLAHVTPESSTDESERSNDSSHTMASHYKDVSPRHRHVVRPPTNTYRSRSSLEKPIGQLRKLKNKLGLVFHHHHHHHHHHHERMPTTSIWKNLHKKLHNEKQGANEKQAIQKSRKRLIGKNQVGHCHALVQGLMRHIKHSKKLKPSKSSPRWKGNVHHDRERHSCQMFHPRQGVKLSTKGHVKLGLVRKNPRLKAPS